MCFDHLFVNNADDADAAAADDGENTSNLALLNPFLLLSFIGYRFILFFLKRIENLDEIWASHLLISKQVYFCLYLQ